MKPITIRYLSGHDVAELALDNDEILDVVEASGRTQGDGVAAVLEYFAPLLASLDRDRPLQWTSK